MTDFYNKFKDLFDGDGPISIPTTFNQKGSSGAMYGGNSTSAKDYNFKDYKNLFEEDPMQARKQYGGGLNQKNYYQDSLDDPQLALPKKYVQNDDGNQFISRKSPVSIAQKDYQNMDQFGQFNKFSNQPLEQVRTNSRQSQKRDTLAANAERLLQQDFSSYNRNSSANQFNERPSQNIYDNPAKQGFTLQDNYQNLNNNNAYNYSKPNIQSSKPPLYTMEKYDNFPNKNREEYNYSPLPLQQQKQNNQGLVKASHNNQNQAQFFNNQQDKSNQVMKQNESSPVANVSKQRKYQDLYGSSALNIETKPQQKQTDIIDNQIQAQNQQSGIPRQRGGAPVNSGPKQHYEERNQGLLDILYLKKRFVDHKIITDMTGFPGQGQYRDALFNRIKASKNLTERKEQLKQLFKQDRVF